MVCREEDDAWEVLELFEEDGHNAVVEVVSDGAAEGPLGDEGVRLVDQDYRRRSDCEAEQGAELGLDFPWSISQVT